MPAVQHQLPTVEEVSAGGIVVDTARDTLDVAIIARLNRGIATCQERLDAGSRELLETILEGEESHADWLETHLELVRQIGEAHYLAQQVRG